MVKKKIKKKRPKETEPTIETAEISQVTEELNEISKATIQEAVRQTLQEYQDRRTPSPSPPPPLLTIPHNRNEIMASILAVLQDPPETMYKGLSARAQNELSPQEVRELRELFSIFDLSGGGRLTYPVLRKSLKTMGFSADDKELEGAIADCNIDVKAGISFPQFVDIVLIEQGDCFDVYEELMSGFTAMDIDRSGKITSNSLRKLCKRLDEELSTVEIEDMVSEADKSGNGEVSHREFITVMLRTNLFRGTNANCHIEQ